MTLNKQKLWTRDFTILILGSFVSMLGFSATGYAFGLMVFDQTESTFLYALMQVVSMLPQLAAPIFAGAFFDRRSRRKAIYTIDFIYTVLYGIITLFMAIQGSLEYILYLCIIFIFGVLNSYYMVAYDSYFPNVISKDNYSKAYAIGSLLYPVASVIMVPFAGFIYAAAGPIPLFAGSTVLFLITAIIETQIKAYEPHLDMVKEKSEEEKHLTPFERFRADLKFGLNYLKQEKGLMTVTIYFFFTMGTGAVLTALFLPYISANVGEFRFSFNGKEIVWGASILYSLIMTSNTFGRLVGGFFHYKRKINPQKKFDTALFVYLTISVLDGLVLFMPAWYFMIILQFMSGALAVTSYNIRISATQNYLPDNVRARFNATFQLLTSLGTIIGQLVGGALGEVFDKRVVVMVAMIINILAILTIIVPGKEYVKPIYNCDI